MSIPHLSIIIPFHNEERTIAELMRQLIKAVPEAEIIYVDDGSTDTSLALVRAGVRSHDLVLTQRNGGKGSAVIAGLLRATGEYTLIQDADLEYDPMDIPLLLQMAKEKCADAIVGSRLLRKQERAFDTWWYYVGGVFCTWVYNVLYNRRLTDMHSCYKLVRTELLRLLPLRQKGFGFDTETIVLLTLRGIHILERGISYRPRSRAEGKNIRWKDGVHCLWLLFSLRIASLFAIQQSR
ncbi:MAG TPA: glycosyltransferase family 2 protein [Candidatus Peribacterales bacterium]|nr:glycosyltransferase family 2 protein [Candidatus Peribacterales bacterium]